MSSCGVRRSHDPTAGLTVTDSCADRGPPTIWMPRLAYRLHPLPYASPHRPSRRMQPLRASQTEVAESLHLLKFPEAATEARSGLEAVQRAVSSLAVTDASMADVRQIAQAGCCRRLAAGGGGRCRLASANALLPLALWQDEIAQIVDGIWSLQYMAAGPICGSAGPLSQFRCCVPQDGAPGPAAPGAQPWTCQPFTHAVLFRYANAVARERFEAQPRVQLMLGGTGAPAGTGGSRTVLLRDCCVARVRSAAALHEHSSR